PTPLPTPTPSDTTQTPTLTPTPTDTTQVPTQTPTLTPTPTETTLAPTPTPSGTSIPTELPLLIPTTQAVTVDPSIANLLNNTPAETTKPVSEGLLNIPTQPLNETTPPVAAGTVPPSDHSDNRGKSGDVEAVDAPRTTVGVESSTLQTVRYVVSAVVAISLATLTFFQFLAINPAFIAPDALVERLLAPNAWELPMFVSFLQGVGVLSFVVNANIPQLFYMNFLDSLSWINFLIRASAPPAAGAVVSSVQVASSVSASQLATASHRQLATTSSAYDASGFIGFAHRSYVNEKDWFLRIWIALLVVVAVVLAVAVVVGVVGRLKGRRSPFNTNSSSNAHTTARSLHSVSQRLLGICVTVVTLSYLPLAMISMFEIRQDATAANFPHTNAVLAMVTLALLIGALVAGVVLLYRKTEAGLSKWQIKVVWGALYSPYHYRHRCFFAVPLLVQLLSGVLVANVTSSGTAPLIALIVLHAVYVLLVLVLQPFADTLQLVATLAIEAALLVVFGVACGLAKSPLGFDAQQSLSYIIIVLVIVVTIAVLLRQLLMLWTFASGWAKPSEDQFTGLYTANEHEMDTNEGYTISLQGSSSHHQTPSRENDYDVPNTIQLISSPQTHYEQVGRP
ncbi:mucin-like protein, partial [Achlya hypogyna]